MKKAAKKLAKRDVANQEVLNQELKTSKEEIFKIILDLKIDSPRFFMNLNSVGPQSRIDRLITKKKYLEV